jgi:hypothetical protein
VAPAPERPLTDHPDDIPGLRAAVVARLREGYESTRGDRETNTRLAYESGRCVFVSYTYDSLVLDPDAPIDTAIFADDAAVLSHLAPTPETVEGWQAVLRALHAPRRQYRAGEGRAVRDVPVDGLVFEGVLADGTRWSARAEGVEERYLGLSEWPHVRFLVTLDPTDGPPDHGPFAWRVPGPDAADWREDGLRALRKAVESRLAARLAVARLLDFSAPEPLPGGGTWSARHVDRYEDDGVGFALTVVTAGAEASTHHTLARPGSTDPQRERTAARTRLTKWIRRQLRGLGGED